MRAAGIPRAIALVLVALGVAGAVVASIYALTLRGRIPTEQEIAESSRIFRAAWVLANSKYGMAGVVAGFLSAAAAAALGWFAWKGRHKVLLAIAAIAVGGVIVAWAGRAMVVRMEDKRYAGRSPYVAAATRVAQAGTAYFGAVAVFSIAGYVLSRRKGGAAASAAAPEAKAAGEQQVG
jgi:prolipoprotein diacylglyceryltransferase